MPQNHHCTPLYLSLLGSRLLLSYSDFSSESFTLFSLASVLDLRLPPHASQLQTPPPQPLSPPLLLNLGLMCLSILIDLRLFHPLLFILGLISLKLLLLDIWLLLYPSAFLLVLIFVLLGIRSLPSLWILVVILLILYFFFWSPQTPLPLTSPLPSSSSSV